jgi:hypothetical protein
VVLLLLLLLGISAARTVTCLQEDFKHNILPERRFFNIAITKLDKDILLQLQEEAKPDASCAFPPVDREQLLQHSMLGKQHAEDVTDHYEIGRVLGAGNYGTTRIAVQKATGEMFACKSIMKSRCASARSSACNTADCCF